MASEDNDGDTLRTVQDYINDARTLLLDTIQPYRYDDPSLLRSLNLALLEGKRVRSDLFVERHGHSVPSFSTVAGQEICIEAQFRLAFVYGICAHALSRDQEDVQDARANSFRSAMHAILNGTNGGMIVGGTPAAQANGKG